jgi:hypothetical protein
MKCRKYYVLNLESIAVNGQTLPIDSSLFTPSNEHFTFVDTGTTLVYLADGVYDPFINAVRSHYIFTFLLAIIRNTCPTLLILDATKKII